MKRIFPRGALLKYRVHMADEQQRRFGAAGIPFADQHIPCVRHRQDAGMDSRALHLSPQNAADRVYALDLPGTALRIHQLLPQGEHGRALPVNIAADLFKILFHRPSLPQRLTAYELRRQRSARTRWLR